MDTYLTSSVLLSPASAFRDEAAELTKETRRLGQGVRELAEGSPQLKEEVRALSRRVDALREDREVSVTVWLAGRRHLSIYRPSTCNLQGTLLHTPTPASTGPLASGL